MSASTRSLLALTLALSLECSARGEGLSDWYDGLKRFSPAIGMMVSCCEDYDAVYADRWRVDELGQLFATVTGSGPRNHWWAPLGREFHVPDYMIVANSNNPTGHSLLFLSPLTLEVRCFVFAEGV